MIRVLIADDEPLGRERLRRFLATETKAELVGESADGLDAVRLIRETSPDLVFLDVDMPGLDGFGVVEALGGAWPPAVIFVTAHNRFALRAFEANAVDYLLKPVDRERFLAAYKRASQRLRQAEKRSPEPPRSMATEVLGGPDSNPARSRIAVKAHGRISLVGIDEIQWVRAADNYVELHTAQATHLLRITITLLAAQLPANQFVRVSRSTLVNLERIKEIRTRSHGDCLVVLHDGTALPGSRTYRQNLARFLGR